MPLATLFGVVIWILTPLFGFFLYGAPLGPDVPHPFTHYAGAFLVFSSWVASFYFWGSLFLKGVFGFELRSGFPLTPRFFVSLAVGSALSSLLITGFGFLGFIGRAYFPLYVGLILISGVLWLWEFSKECPSLKWKWPLEKKELALLALLGFVLWRSLGSFLPHTHSDPFFYHLMAPRFWFDHGVISKNPEHPLFLTSGFWESLYLWAMHLFSSEKGEGLLVSQLACQWLHYFLGFGGCAFLLFHLVLKETKAPFLSLVATVLALSSLSNLGTAWLSKNMWGLSFWILAGFWIWVDVGREPLGPSKKKGSVFLSGVLMGLGAFSKLNLTLSVAGLLFWGFFLKEKKEIRSHFWILALGAFVASLPLFLRNLIYTGNPFFPLFNGMFPSSLVSNYYLERVAANQSETLLLSFQFFKEGIKRFLNENPLNWGAMVLVPVSLLVFRLRAFKSRNFLTLTIFLMGLCGLFSTAMFGGVEQHFRYLGILLWLVPLLTVCSVWDLIRNYQKTRKIERGFFALLGVLLFTSHHVFWIPLDLFRGPSFPVALRERTWTGDSLAWIRLNVPFGAKIASTGNLEFYYLNGYETFVLTESRRLDLLSRGAKTPFELVKRLRSEGFLYVVNALTYDGEVWGGAGEAFYRFAKEHSEVISFYGRHSEVIDLKKVEALVTL